MITIDGAQMARAQAVLRHIPGAAPKAMARALNRAAETAKTEAARKVRELYYIKHRDILDTISIKKATPSDLAATVVSKGSPVALSKFRVTPRQPQPKRRTLIKVRVMRGEGGPIKRAFVAKMQSGHIGVFNRAGAARFPISQRFGPSVPQMLGSPTVTDWVNEKATERLEERLDHEINRILEGNS